MQVYDGEGVEPRGPIPFGLDGLLPPLPECGPHLPVTRNQLSDLLSLADALRSPQSGEHREPLAPHHRQPTWSPVLAERVPAMRRQYPRWGKDRLIIQLAREQRLVSASMVEGILTQMKRRGWLLEPTRSGVSGSHRALRTRPYAVRKAVRGFSPRRFLVEVDILDVHPCPGVIFKQFTTRNVVARWDMIQAHTRATAPTAAQFLDTLLHRMPFHSRPASRWGKGVRRRLRASLPAARPALFALPLRSPKLNGAVERANRTHWQPF